MREETPISWRWYSFHWYSTFPMLRVFDQEYSAEFLAISVQEGCCFDTVHVRKLAKITIILRDMQSKYLWL